MQIFQKDTSSNSDLGRFSNDELKFIYQAFHVNLDYQKAFAESMTEDIMYAHQSLILMFMSERLIAQSVYSAARGVVTDQRELR